MPRGRDAEPKVTLDAGARARASRPTSTTASSSGSAARRPSRSSGSSRRVVRALLLQELARLPAARCPRRARACCRGPGENAGAVDIGDGLRSSSRSRATTTRRSSSRSRARPPAWAASCATSSRWARGRSRSWTRCASATPDDPQHAPPGATASSPGIGGYGNCFGVPTVGGEVAFAPGYDGNILVNVMSSASCAPTGSSARGREGVGNPVIYVGTRPGRDGIHGASLASRRRSTRRRGAAPDRAGRRSVHREAADRGVPRGDGAPTPSSASRTWARPGSRAARSRWRRAAAPASSSTSTACRSARTGMTPYEILLSESQERMLLVGARGREEEVRARLRASWELDAVVIGDGHRRRRLARRAGTATRWRDLPVEPLTDGARATTSRRAARRGSPSASAFDPRTLPAPADYGAGAARRCSRRPTIASQGVGLPPVRPARRQQHVVAARRRRGACCASKGTRRGDRAVHRLQQPLRAASIRIAARRIAVAEAARNVAVRGRAAARRHRLPELRQPRAARDHVAVRRGVEGIADACLALGTPVVSGNVSFYNETDGPARSARRRSIGMVGPARRRRALARARQWFKGEGDAIVLLGRTRESLGGSEYLARARPAGRAAARRSISRPSGGCRRRVPGGDRGAAAAPRTTCAEGGLAVALAECVLQRPGAGGRARSTLPAGARRTRALRREPVADAWCRVRAASVRGVRAR